MIIAINGQLVNTKNIYLISEIKFSQEGNYYFKIYFFNDKKLNIYFSYTNLPERNIIVDGKKQYYHQFYKQSWIDEHYPELLEKITEFRNQIVKVWSENQSEIPQFNL